MDQAHLIAGMDRILRKLGGTTREWRTDRLATVIVPGTGDVQPSFAPVAKHYGAVVVACPPRRGNRKGSVESSVRFVTGRWWRTMNENTIEDAERSLDRFLETTGDARPARRGTASVVLVDGAPALHVEPGGGSVLTFSDASDDALMRAFSKGLPSVSGIARRALTIESIDGAAALSSRWAPVLDRAGLRRDYRGFVAITSPVANSWNAPPDEQAD